MNLCKITLAPISIYTLIIKMSQWLIDFLCLREHHRRRRWNSTPVLSPGKSHGRRSLVAAAHEVAKSQTRMSDFTFTFHFHALEKERKWQPTPVFLPGESQGQGSLVGCCLWGHTESDTTEVT